MKLNNIINILILLPIFAYGDVVDVTDFGAIANDNIDDTDAIELAVARATELRMQLLPEGGSKVGVGPAVYFPSGVYSLSRTIDLSGYSSLQSGPGKAMLIWVGEDDGVMFRFRAYTNKVQNLKFLGGGTHLLFENGNTNQTLIEIDSCEFQYATGFSIRAIPYGSADHLSAQVTIRNCKFIYNYQCLETYADYCILADSWMELRQPQMIDGPAVVNRYGFLFFDRLAGIPGADISKAPEGIGLNLEAARWVDNYGFGFTAKSCRFGAEGGGIPVVYNFRPLEFGYPWTRMGAQIIISDSAVYTGSLAREMGGVIIPYALPQKVIFNNNTGPVNNPLFKIPDGSSIESDVDSVLMSSVASEMVVFRVASNVTYPPHIEDGIPEFIRSFLVPSSGCPD